MNVNTFVKQEMKNGQGNAKYKLIRKMGEIGYKVLVGKWEEFRVTILTVNIFW